MNIEDINIEDIKVGEMYNVRMQVRDYANGIIFCCTVISIDEKDGVQCGEEYDICHDEIAAFSEITPENGTKNSEPAPKYDPCRLFRKGDKVRVVTYKGRNKTGVEAGEIGSIYKDEKDADVTVEVIFYGDDLWEVDPAYLELVTPVEELEPFTCGESIDGCILYKNGDYYAEFLNSEDAQRACKLLNAEHRKEQK